MYYIRHMANKRNFRCAICGKQHGRTYNYRHELARQGYKSTRATIECMGELPRPDFSNVTILPTPAIVDPITGLMLGPGA